MKPLEVRLGIGRYELAVSLQRRSHDPSVVPAVALPVVVDVEPKTSLMEARRQVEEVSNRSRATFVISAILAVFVVALVCLAIYLRFPWNLSAAFYIVFVAIIVGMPHVLPRTPLSKSMAPDMFTILSPLIFPWSSVMFAVFGAVAAIMAGYEGFSSDLRGFLNGAAYLIPVVGLMFEANKSFAEAADRVLPPPGFFRGDNSSQQDS